MSKICFIGSGNMAEAIIGGILDANLFLKDDIIASDINLPRLNHIRESFEIQTCMNEPGVIREADIVILSIKPQTLTEVMNALSPFISSDALIISILAGVSMKTIETHFPDASAKPRIARIMPNLGAFIRKSVSAICFNDHIRDSDKSMVKSIFSSIGTVHVCREKDMDLVTAVSGSGPAYLFFFIEAFVEAAHSLGMTQEQALAFCLETLDGASELLLKKTDSPAKLREKVTSKGGTTEAAIRSLEKHQFKAIMKTAVEAARNRSLELGKLC